MPDLSIGRDLFPGNGYVPGYELRKEILEQIPKILKACKDFGLDFYDTIIEEVDYDQMAEFASYGGFPKRYHHWKWGMEYEEMIKGFEHNQYRIYEMVINTDPCIMYLLNSNNLVDHIDVIAHATAHNDFFKKNIYFQKTSKKMLNETANHASRIDRYMAEYGGEVVQRFLDTCLQCETLVDPINSYLSKRKEIESGFFNKKKKYEMRTIKLAPEDMYMNDWINPKEYIEQEKERIKNQEIKDKIGILSKPDKDVMGFLINNAPLEMWQQDVLSIIYKESMYFAPQGMTKVANEGWASFVDAQIMARFGFAKDEGIFSYSDHKAGVLGGKYSTNPYRLGYSIFLEVEERYNKGKFGYEYEKCKDVLEKERWNKHLGLGMEKLFEIREFYDDIQLIIDFFDEEFCKKYEYFEYKTNPDGSKEIASKDHAKIKEKLILSRLNRGLPETPLVETNFKDKKIMILKHNFDGRYLYPKYCKAVVKSLSYLWKNPVALVSVDTDGKEFCFYADKDTKDTVKTTLDEI